MLFVLGLMLVFAAAGDLGWVVGLRDCWGFVFVVLWLFGFGL